MAHVNKVKAAQDRIRRWRKDPVLFVREVFNVEPDLWQARVLAAFARKECDHIAMQACAGPGKSAVLAWCGWNFLVCYAEKGHHPVGLATSISADNLRDNLWKEFSVWQQRSAMLLEMFVWTKQRIFAKDHPETWWISARTFSKDADPEKQGRTLSGLHSKYILYLVDESGDIPPAVLRSAEQGLGNCAWGKILQAGNPTSTTGMLYTSVTHQRALWEVIRITGDPDDPDRSQRIDIQWARTQVELYGRDNPWVMAFILGKFPPTALNTLLGPDEVEEAMNRHLTKDTYEWSQKRLGIDVARFGDDRSVIFPRQGLASFRPVEMRIADTTQIAARVMLAIERWHSELELIDDTGHWGHGVYDNLNAIGRAPIAVQFSGKPLDPRYANRRTEMWLLMAKWVKGGGSLPKLPALVPELTMPTYYFAMGKFHLEDKDSIKKRLGRSPDLADALALTFAIPDVPREMTYHPSQKRQLGKLQYEYDPLATGIV